MKDKDNMYFILLKVIHFIAFKKQRYYAVVCRCVIVCKLLYLYKYMYIYNLLIQLNLLLKYIENFQGNNGIHESLALILCF